MAKLSPFKEATLYGHSSEIEAVAVSKDGEMAETNFFFALAFSLLNHAFSSLRCSGMFIVSAAADGMIKIWDAVGGRELVTLEGHKGPVTSLSITPDSK